MFVYKMGVRENFPARINSLAPTYSHYVIEAEDDVKAIARAEEIPHSAQVYVQAGCKVEATLWFRDRMIKSFSFAQPEQAATSQF